MVELSTHDTGTIIPDKQLWAGNPAVYIRDVTDQEMAGFIKVRTLRASLSL